MIPDRYQKKKMKIISTGISLPEEGFGGVCDNLTGFLF
jgi:hypothetical protein